MVLEGEKQKEKPTLYNRRRSTRLSSSREGRGWEGRRARAEREQRLLELSVAEVGREDERREGTEGFCTLLGTDSGECTAGLGGTEEQVAEL